MLTTLVDEPFDSKKWVYETNCDGSRLYRNRCRPVHVEVQGD